MIDIWRIILIDIDIDCLTASLAKNTILCFPWLLFGEDMAWTQQGKMQHKSYWKQRKAIKVKVTLPVNIRRAVASL